MSSAGTASNFASPPDSSSIFSIPRGRQRTTTPGSSGKGVCTSTSTGSSSSATVCGDVAVVGRIVHGRTHEAVDEQRAGLLVHFILDRDPRSSESR